MKQRVLERCQRVFPGWSELAVQDVEFEPPKGFSSLTMAVRPQRDVDPPGAFYRHLEGKENAILGFEQEREVFLALGQGGIAARCLDYRRGYRLETLYQGRTLRAEELREPVTLRRIGTQLAKFHRLSPPALPQRSFFGLLHRQWGALARKTLARRGELPAAEQALCGDLAALHTDETRAMVRRFLPDRELGFCHNDTYHGNIMRLADGAIRLLDFEFSCLGHRCYDFSNLFAETVMIHGLAEPPHFRIGPPGYTREHVALLIDAYLEALDDPRAPSSEALIDETLSMIPLSDYIYAMAAVPLALAPIQRLRFIPYAHARFLRFREAHARRFGR